MVRPGHRADRRTNERLKQTEGQREAEEEARTALQIAAGLLRAAITESHHPSSRSDMPLNRPGIIAAAGRNPYGPKPFPRGSASDLIRRGLIGGSEIGGRNEWQTRATGNAALARRAIYK